MILTGNEHVDCKSTFMDARNNYIRKHNKPIDLIMLGDSITEGFNIQYYYPTDKIIVNSGISGDRIMSMRARLKRDVLDFKPKQVVLNVGINDLMHFEEGDRAKVKDKVDQLFTEYVNIVKVISDANIEVYCASIMKIAEQAYDENKNHFTNYMFINYQIQLLNHKIKEYCNNQGHKYLDYNRVITNEYNQLNESFAYDGLHMNVKGYLELIKVLEAAGVL